MKPTKTLNLIFFGPQGSGKGTQAKLLAAKLGMRHLSSGEVLRETAKMKTSMGRYLAKQMTTGTLTPIPVFLKVCEAYIRRFPKTKGVIFDGFGRQISESKILFPKLEKLGHPIDAVILIDILDAETVRRLSKRLQCDSCQRIFIKDGRRIKAGAGCPRCKSGKLFQRADDTPAAIRRRLAIYHKRSKRVLDYYRNQNLVERVSGTQSVSAVHQAVLKALRHKSLVK